jgi:hypothetical protein
MFTRNFRIIAINSSEKQANDAKGMLYTKSGGSSSVPQRCRNDGLNALKLEADLCVDATPPWQDAYELTQHLK